MNRFYELATYANGISHGIYCEPCPPLVRVLYHKAPSKIEVINDRENKWPVFDNDEVTALLQDLNINEDSLPRLYTPDLSVRKAVPILNKRFTSVLIENQNPSILIQDFARINTLFMFTSESDFIFDAFQSEGKVAAALSEDSDYFHLDWDKRIKLTNPGYLCIKDRV